MSEDRVKEIIVDWIREKTRRDFDSETNLLELGVLDSLLFAELVSHLEIELSILLDFSEVDDWSTISSVTGLSQFIEHYRGKST